ncbi:hypothetical protein ACFX13_015154 [Malus domestica]
MEGKRKRIPRYSSSEASTDSPQIRFAVVIPSSNTQGSEPKKKISKTNGKNSDKLQEQLDEKKDVDKMIERIISKYDIDMPLTHVSTYVKNALQG